MKTQALLFLFLLLFSCGKKKQELETTVKKGQGLSQEERASLEVVEQLQGELVQYYQYPQITVILMPQGDVQKSIAALLKGGGALLYDPNYGHGTDIPFYIAHLTPEHINDTQFLLGLNLRQASIDENPSRAYPILDVSDENESTDISNTFIPVGRVALETLGTHRELGKDITVAIVDSGIDASHPAFNGRVVYWYDATMETKTSFHSAQLDEAGEIAIALAQETKKVLIPESYRQGDLYYALMDEKNFTAQLADKKGKAPHQDNYFDLNESGSEDQFLVLMSKDQDDRLQVLFDMNGNLAIDEDELSPLMDYNETTARNRNQGMVKFPARVRVIQYPLLITQEGENFSVQLGVPDGAHGTHVAAITGANWPEGNLLGAAPSAKLMSIKVCSGISCTGSAILKGLYKAFANGRYIPDVVNISLGSYEQKFKRPLSYLIDDLSAKYGTIFFISASNNGPGFRTLNGLGGSSAAVGVGASVSKQTLINQYNLPPNAETADENLLFFSSVGPSYTGEMRPLIVAPGGAIAAVPVKFQEMMSQKNGTSMSSPLAAGTMAAILGKLKERDNAGMERMLALREVKAQGEKQSQASLLKYVYAMRHALAQAATTIPHLTRAQQGYGLMHAGKTLEALDTLFTGIENGERKYFGVTINGNTGGYHRQNRPKKIQKFSLSLTFDGERTQEENSAIIRDGVDVVLDRIEVINHRGEIQRDESAANGRAYFSILLRGSHQNEDVTKTHVTFNNARTPSFFSQRNLEQMQPGHTYIAHYKILHQERRGKESPASLVQNILDVVHVPYELKAGDVRAPAIDPNIQYSDAAIAFSNIPIGINQFHRYPIAVTKHHTALNLRVAPALSQYGRIFVQVYNPKGEEVSFWVCSNSPTTSYIQENVLISTLDSDRGKVQDGVWEVTLSTSSSHWLSALSYDLFIEAQEFGPNIESISLKWGKKAQIPMRISSKERPQFLFSDLRQVHHHQVAVKTHHMSFHPLELPPGERQVGISVLNKNGMPRSSPKHWWGQVDHRLFEKVDGEFWPVREGYQEKSRIFSFSAPPTKQHYYALETIANYSENILSKKSTTTQVTVELSYGTSLPPFLLTVTEKKVPYLEGSLLKIQASAQEIASQLQLISLDSNPPKVRGLLRITNGQGLWPVSVLVQ